MDVQYKCISCDVSTVWHGNISCHVSCHTCPIHVSTMDVTVGVFVRGSKGRCQSEFKTPVEWQIYAHYSGHQSFTKALLLMDMSGGSHKMLEITSQKCEWRARKGHQEWIAVKSSDSELISLDAAGNDVTTFNLVTTNGAKFHNQVHMNMKTKVGKTDIAVLRLSCRPNHNLNLHLTMERRRELSLPGIRCLNVFYCFYLDWM